MYDFTIDETRTYAPAENVNVEIEDYPLLTININHIDNKQDVFYIENKECRRSKVAFSAVDLRQ